MHTVTGLYSAWLYSALLVQKARARGRYTHAFTISGSYLYAWFNFEPMESQMSQKI